MALCTCAGCPEEIRAVEQLDRWQHLYTKLCVVAWTVQPQGTGSFHLVSHMQIVSGSGSTSAKVLLYLRSVKLSDLCVLQAFLTAVMQTYARHHKLPLDVMKFRTDVTTKSVEQITEAAPVGCYIHGTSCAKLYWDIHFLLNFPSLG